MRYRISCDIACDIAWQQGVRGAISYTISHAIVILSHILVRYRMFKNAIALGNKGSREIHAISHAIFDTISQIFL